MSEIERVFREGGLHEVAELLVNPARSGIYLTRGRVRALAQAMNLRPGVQGRSRMLENLFREAGLEGRAAELLDRLDGEAAAMIGRCRAWARACPPGKAAWREWAARAGRLRRCLKEAKRAALRKPAAPPD
ncbi:MAG: hypothetical protein AABZ64_09855 [Nitrospinota bacterium]